MSIQSRKPEIILNGESKKVFLLGLPFPPSVNQLFSGKTRRYTSEAYKAFKWEFDLWSNQRSIRFMLPTTKKFLAQEIEKTNGIIDIEFEFYFDRSTIITKQNKPKRNDTSNRIKGIEDSITELIGIDDAYFWNGRFKKLVTQYKEPYVNVTIRVIGDLGKNEYPVADV